jgi:hypothetical protein
MSIKNILSNNSYDIITSNIVTGNINCNYIYANNIIHNNKSFLYCQKSIQQIIDNNQEYIINFNNTILNNLDFINNNTIEYIGNTKNFKIDCSINFIETISSGINNIIVSIYKNNSILLDAKYITANNQIGKYLLCNLFSLCSLSDGDIITIRTRSDNGDFIIENGPNNICSSLSIVEI